MDTLLVVWSLIAGVVSLLLLSEVRLFLKLYGLHKKGLARKVTEE